MNGLKLRKEKGVLLAAGHGRLEKLPSGARRGGGEKHTDLHLGARRQGLGERDDERRTVCLRLGVALGCTTFQWVAMHLSGGMTPQPSSHLVGFTKRKVERSFTVVVAAEHHTIDNDVAGVENQLLHTRLDDGGDVLDKPVHRFRFKVDVQLW